MADGAGRGRAGWAPPERDGGRIAGARSREGSVRPLYRQRRVRQTPERPDGSGQQLRRVTVYFSDIRNFTTMSEQMTPSQVVSFLNDYFSEMVDAVFAQEGMLDKFLGDGLMAVFGAFGDTSDHPRRAVMAALQMKALLAKINGERAMSGKPAIEIGIGIHTDEVIVGNIGSRKRLEFAAIGDGVNVASRLQFGAKIGAAILDQRIHVRGGAGGFRVPQRCPAVRCAGMSRNSNFMKS